MRYFSDLHRTDLVDRTRMTGENYQVSNKPATTLNFKEFTRGAYRSAPQMDQTYDSDFRSTKYTEWNPFGTSKERINQKGVFYEGDLSLSRHRTVGLVNELIDSHIDPSLGPQNTVAGIAVGSIGRKLTVEEQQAKLEDLQRALLEEAAVLDKMKYYYQDHPNCCPEWLIGDKDKSCMGGCVKFHFCCEVDCCGYGDHYRQHNRQQGRMDTRGL